MSPLKPLKDELAAKLAERAEREAQADNLATARALVAARNREGLTQAEVAQRMGTTQSTVARLEGGKGTPSLRSIQRYAKAIGYRAVVRLVHN